MRYFMLAFCALVFWNCSHDNMPFIAEEDYIGEAPQGETTGQVYLGLSQSFYFEEYAVTLTFTGVYGDYQGLTASFEVKNSVGTLSSFKAKLNEEKIIGGYYDENYHNKLHIKVMEINDLYNWVTIDYWESQTEYGIL